MPVDRGLWQRWLHETGSVPWPCPKCQAGSLTVVNGSLAREETPESLASRDNLAWEPDWVEERFTGLWRCSRQECNEVVAIAGEVGVTEFWEPDPENPDVLLENGIARHLTPAYVAPAPALISVPKGCPKGVLVELRKAFALFWSDRDAAANKLRSALDALLDDIGVNRFRKEAKTGKRVRIGLHQRLELIRAKYPNVIDHLLAAKWIGNSGVHASEITAEDFFDALDLIEESLAEIVAKKSKTLRKIAKAVLRRKGPRSRGGKPPF